MATDTIFPFLSDIEQPISEPKLTTFPYTTNASFVSLDMDADK